MEKQDFTTDDGVCIHVETQGDSELPLIIWSHGFTGSGRNWRSTLRRLPRFRHLTYDLRGHARSGAPQDPSAYTLSRFGRDLVALCDRYSGGKPVALAGLSLGSMIIIEALSQSPESVRALVLSSLPEPTHSKGISRIAPEFAREIREQGLEAAGEQFVWGANSGLGPRDAQLIKQGFMEHPEHSIAASLDGALNELFDSPMMALRLMSAAKPALILYGDQDLPAREITGKLKRELHKEQSSGHRQFQFSEVEGGGHLLNLTSSEVFCDHVDRFFSSNI